MIALDVQMLCGKIEPFERPAGLIRRQSFLSSGNCAIECGFERAVHPDLEVKIGMMRGLEEKDSFYQNDFDILECKVDILFEPGRIAGMDRNRDTLVAAERSDDIIEQASESHPILVEHSRRDLRMIQRRLQPIIHAEQGNSPARRDEAVPEHSCDMALTAAIDSGNTDDKRGGKWSRFPSRLDQF